MTQEETINRYAERVGYTHSETKQFYEGGHRVRQVVRLSEAASLYSIEAEVVEAKHCNSGYKEGDKFVLDVDGNLIGKLCPRRLCVYLISQLTVPVALINERLSSLYAVCPMSRYWCGVSGVWRSNASHYCNSSNKIY